VFHILAGEYGKKVFFVRTGDLFWYQGDIEYRELIPMRKKKIAAVAFALWLTIITVLMLLSERIDLALFFILAFIGFLIIVELMEPRYLKPRYQLYIHVLIAVGIVIFVAVIINKLLDLLGLELVLA
jgi:hypothetical protein